MRTRQLGNSDLHITTVGFGAWAIGGGDWAFGWGPQDDADSVAAIREALDRGINWIDTAAVYGLGHSEELVGRALRERGGDPPIVATKCGLRWRENRQIYNALKKKSVKEEAENSLRRLGVDVIDLYQIHWPIPDRDIEHAWEGLQELREEGKIRYAAVSNFSVEQIRRCQRIGQVTSNQPPLSMVQRMVEDEILPFCAAHDIGTVAYSPMEAGLLTGTFSHARRDALAEGDWRRDAPSFQDPTFSKTLELCERLTPVAERSGHTLAQLALAWVIARPGVTAAIAGGRNPRQVQETAAAGDWALSEGELAEIDALLAEVAVPNPGTLR